MARKWPLEELERTYIVPNNTFIYEQLSPSSSRHCEPSFIWFPLFHRPAELTIHHGESVALHSAEEPDNLRPTTGTVSPRKEIIMLRSCYEPDLPNSRSPRHVTY